MTIDDFRCTRRGIQLHTLNSEQSGLINEVHQQTKEKNSALLMLHGFSSSPAIYRAMLPEIKGYDAIVCPLLPGHGQSVDAFEEVKADEWIKAVEHHCESLLGEYKRVDVLGLSLGGILACHLAQRYPLGHLYLLAPALDLQLAVKQYLLLLKGLRRLGFQRLRSFAGDLYTSHECEIAYRQVPLATIIEIFNLIDRFKLTEIKCPTDIFLGCHDHIVCSWRVADRFVDKKNINIHWLLNTAHLVPLDGDIDRVLDCINENIAN